MVYQLDDKDKTILMCLQEAAMTNLQLAKKVGLSPAATLARVKKLEQAGVITGYGVDLDKSKLGYDLLCFIQVSLKQHDVKLVKAFRESINAMPNVIECHFLTGMSDYLLKVVLKNREDLEQFLVNILTPAPGVERIQTSLVLNEVKTKTTLPLLET